jgi:hypothetical protein
MKILTSSTARLFLKGGAKYGLKMGFRRGKLQTKGLQIFSLSLFHGEKIKNKAH